MYAAAQQKRGTTGARKWRDHLMYAEKSATICDGRITPEPTVHREPSAASDCPH